MLYVDETADTTDDPTFLRLVHQIIAGAMATHQSPDFFIFKIDNWFDHKWLQFSGKVVGAVGSWRRQLTIPPLVANRIASQAHYVIDQADGNYQFEGAGPAIHYRGPSADNLNRSIKKIAVDSALFWYSGNTATTGRGSLMGYIPIDDDHWPWLLAFVRDGEWRIARRKQIHEYEVRAFQDAGQRVTT